MPDAALIGLLSTAAAIALLHTLAGPDHYVPFVALAVAGRWSRAKLLAVTAACGLGHVLSSVLLGLGGIAVGLAAERVVPWETWRGSLAAWLLLGFGLAYAAWGLRAALRNRPHTHVHVHADGTVHSHPHVHQDEHTHVHVAPPRGREDAHAQEDNEPAHTHAEAEPARAHPEAAPARVVPRRITPWVLFLIFVFGPCEPLIPLLYAALHRGVAVCVLVGLVFSVLTIGTMLAVVTLGHVGLRRLPLAGVGRYSHALAGVALSACGGAMLLGL